MKKYRISYDRHLNLLNLESINYKGEYIMGLSASFEITAFKNGREEYFLVEDNEEPCEQYFYGDRNDTMYGHSLSAAFYFFVDQDCENGYRLELSDLAKLSKYDFKIQFDSACKWVDNWNNVIKITHDEFVDILKKNITVFDYSDNKPAQSCSYGCRIVCNE